MAAVSRLVTTRKSMLGAKSGGAGKAVAVAGRACAGGC